MENHKQTRRTIIGKRSAIFLPFLWNRCFNNRVKSSGEVFCFDLVQEKPRFAYGRGPQLLTKPQNQLLLSFGDTRTPVQKINKIPNHFQKQYYVYKYQNCETPIVWHFPKRRAPANDEDSCNKISKILNMGPISSWKHEMFFGNI